MTIKPTTSLRLFTTIYHLFILPVIVLSLLLATSVQADSPLDSYTPSAFTSGSPAGSYPLSGFENINIFNGNLTIDLKVGQVMGRGGAQWPINFHLETTHWSVDKVAQPYNCTPTDICYDYFYYPNEYMWTGTNGPADLFARHTHAKYDPSCQGAGDTALTRLTFRVPDGTEYQLVDQITGGIPQTKYYAGCASNTPQPPFNRGKIFVTTDGTAVTFVSDTDIADQYSGTGVSYPSGYLLLRDGNRYRIDNGWISWIRDRNGNKITFTRDSQYPSSIQKITDSLNREVTYGNGFTFKGFGGATRTVQYIKDNYLDENVMLRRDFRTSQGGTGFRTYQQLFPNLNGSYSGTFNFSEVTRIVLPNGQFYRLYYSPYGNIARIELPTGGAIEYDISIWAPGNEVIEQRLVERREYLSSAANTPVYKRTTYSPTQTKTYDGSGNLLSAENHYFTGSASIQFDPFAYDTWDTGKEYKTELLAADGTTVLRKTENTWQQGCGPGGLNTTPRPNNPHITQTITTLVDSNQASKQTFSYDCYNNPTDVYEYDYGSGTPPTQYMRRTHTDYITSTTYTDTTVHLRSLPSVQQTFDTSGTKRAETLYEYDDYSATPNHAGLVNRTNISGLDAAFTTSKTTRGNVTKISNWRDTDNTYINSYLQYDIAGNVVQNIDANGNASTLDYSDRFGSPNGDAQTNAPAGEATYVTAPSVWLAGQSTFAFPTKATNAKGHIAYTQFDYFMGKPVDTEDPNGVKGSLYYSDPLDRLTQGRRNVTSATAYYIQTTIAYDDNNRIITVSGDKTAANDNVIVSKTLYDGLGRTYRKAAYENVDATKPWIITETQFDALGRAYRTTNPFRAAAVTTALASPEWTTSTFDALGRVLTVTSPDTAVVQTQYSGNAVTVIDQTKKVRRSITDGLGRLTRVDEPTRDFTSTELTQNPLNPDLLLGSTGSPTQSTSYSYDALDDLLTVNQGGANPHLHLRFAQTSDIGRFAGSRHRDEQCPH